MNASTNTFRHLQVPYVVLLVTVVLLPKCCGQTSIVCSGQSCMVAPAGAQPVWSGAALSRDKKDMYSLYSLVEPRDPHPHDGAASFRSSPSSFWASSLPDWCACSTPPTELAVGHVLAAHHCCMPGGHDRAEVGKL